ncbi:MULTISPECIES: DUF397 domain-containing protein [unclassified Streptomyces]|uniref:DUF397 domain-containing protein n=1 Tax=unclassified Streptomyces TaxID=2593676 RepID=UPI0037FDBACE
MTREPSTGNPTDPQWFKSSYSGSNDNDCVEVCAAPHAAVLVRDSKAIDRPHLGSAAEAWAAFVAVAA